MADIYIILGSFTSLRETETELKKINPKFCVSVPPAPNLFRGCGEKCISSVFLKGTFRLHVGKSPLEIK